MRIQLKTIARQESLATTIACTCALAFTLWLLMACNTGGTFATDSGTFYVDGANGNDQWPGTQEQPWRTLESANQRLNAGDTVVIHGGAYDESIVPKHSGELGRMITYVSYPGEHVIIRGKPGVTELVVLRRSYIKIDGLELSYGHSLPNAERGWAWVSISGPDAHHNVVQNCRLVRDGDPLAMYRDKYREGGIVLNRTQYNLIQNNYIRGLNMGIHIIQAARYNRIIKNYVTETSQSAVVVSSSEGILQGNLIEGNTLERSTIEDGIQFLQSFESDDTSTDISNFGTIVRNNTIRYNAENAIDLKGARYVVIEGNVIYGTTGSNNGGLDGWNRNSLATINRGAGASSSDIIIRKNMIFDNANGIRVYDGYKVYNNTVLYNNRDFTGSQSNWDPASGAFFFGISERVVGTRRLGIKNNIVGGHRYAGEVMLRVGDSSDLDIDHNLYFNPDHVQIVDVNTQGDMDIFDLNAWRLFLARQRVVRGAEVDSLLTADPELDYGSGVPTGELTPAAFELRPTSPAIDQGGPLTVAQSEGSGRKLVVQDASYFFDGYGAVPGDWIRVGNNPPVLIVAIDYEANQITVHRSISWQAGDGVSLPYNGAAPDIGAREFGGDPIPLGLGISTFLPLIVVVY